MRVLMTADAVGGVWTYALELAAALDRYHVEVHLAVMGDAPKPHQHQQAAALDNVRLHIGAYKLEWMTDPWNDVDRAGEWLQSLAHEIRPDLVHLNGYVHAALDFGAPVLDVAHSCVYSWWEAIKRTTPPPEHAVYRARVERGLQAANRVIAPTHAMLNALHRHCTFATPEGVIANGTDVSRYHPADKESFILTVGRLWDEAKNVRVLDEIAPDLPYPIYAAGMDTSPGGDTTSTQRLSGLGFLPREELAAWYARAAVYALPAYYEPFGLSVLEAALSGCALVLGDIESLRENWDSVARFVPPDDPARLLHTLRELFDQPALLQHMGERARLHAMSFSRENMARAYFQVYRELIGAD